MRNSEKRKYPRVAAGLKVRFRRLDEPTDPIREGVLENISLGGLFLTTARTLGPRTAVFVELPLVRDSGEPVRANAVVRWERTSFEPFGMGLEFTGFEGSSRRRLHEWIEQLLSTVPQRVV